MSESHERLPLPVAIAFPSTKAIARVFRVRLRPLLCAIALIAGPVARAQDASREYELKAAFLYNFAKFVQWGPERLSGPADPVVIGILGRNPFGSELARIVRNRKVDGRPLEIRAVDSAAEASAAQILFVPAGEEYRFAPMREALVKAGVLTVGESPDFAAAGGIVTFVLDANRVRFAINRDASDRTGLKIAAQLLRLAVSLKPSSP